MTRVSRWRRQWTGKALPVGIVLGIIASGAMVWQATEAAFTSQTSTGNHVGAGTVVITNERTGTTLISVSDLTPGNSAVECVKVTYTGTSTAVVKLYAGTYVDTDDLGGTVTITVETADAGVYGNNCATFLGNITTIVTAETADTFAARTAFGTGAPSSNPWTPTGTTARTKAYRITATLPSNADNGLQGTSLDLVMTWEAQSV